MKRRLLSLLSGLLISAPFIVAPVGLEAAEIDFTRVIQPPDNGSGDEIAGTLDGTVFFTGKVTINGNGATSARSSNFVFPIPDAYFIPYSDVFFTLDGVGEDPVLQIMMPPGFQLAEGVVNDGVNSTTALGVVQNGTYMYDLFEGPVGPTFADWQMLSSISGSDQSGLFVNWSLEPAINTDQGILVFDGFPANLLSSFEAVVQGSVIAPIPLPAGMVLSLTAIAGLGAIGSLRRCRDGRR